MTEQKTETQQEQSGVSRREMIELIRYEGYNPVEHWKGTSFLDSKGRVVGTLLKDSTELSIEYGTTLGEGFDLNRETFLAQGEFYRICQTLRFSPRETYRGSVEELEDLYKIFDRLMEGKR